MEVDITEFWVYLVDASSNVFNVRKFDSGKFSYF